jgi:hypothetical protein
MPVPTLFPLTSSREAVRNSGRSSRKGDTRSTDANFVSSARCVAWDNLDRRCQRPPNHLLVRADEHTQWSIEGERLDNPHRRTRADPQPLQVAQALRVLIGDAPNDCGIPRCDIEEFQFGDVGNSAVEIRNRITVGINRGIAEGCRHPGLQCLRDMVLQPFGLLMDLIPAEAEGLDQIPLQEPVMPDDLEGNPFAVV